MSNHMQLLLCTHHSKIKQIFHIRYKNLYFIRYPPIKVAYNICVTIPISKQFIEIDQLKTF